MLVKGKTGSYAVLQVAVQHTLARQLSTAQEHEPNLLHCDRHTHGSARHFNLTFIDSQAMVAVDVCIAWGMATMLSGAITCSNIVGELWRNPMLTTNAISRLSHSRNGSSSSSAARNAYSLLDWGPRFLSKNAQPLYSH